jgi:hypothetical protein
MTTYPVPTSSFFGYTDTSIQEGGSVNARSYQNFQRRAVTSQPTNVGRWESDDESVDV